ncbi:MAG TPA: roadblock/LC7 domain-containing protein [Thermoanaerobaculia bacterium]|nr:roadblock/LC7 domain-containing protein [Thermoanaerobaculia bacterium]
MFKEQLTSILEKVEGAVAASLVGLDGIEVERVGDREIPLETLAAEFGSFVKSISQAGSDLDAGSVEQFSLVTEKYITFLSSVTTEYFILLVLRAGGNYGRARFELAKARFALRDELS